MWLYPNGSSDLCGRTRMVLVMYGVVPAKGSSDVCGCPQMVLVIYVVVPKWFWVCGCMQLLFWCSYILNCSDNSFVALWLLVLLSGVAECNQFGSKYVCAWFIVGIGFICKAYLWENRGRSLYHTIAYYSLLKYSTAQAPGFICIKNYYKSRCSL